jgi:carbon monoxide dehydrogenase subunit G
MKFENRAVVPVSPEKLWDVLMDIKSVAACIPGVEELREIDSDTYLGAQRIKVGPISLHFTGKMTIIERDRDIWRAAMKAEGADKGAGGAVKATITMSLKQLAVDQTELVVDTDANVMGRLGEFGQPIMRKKADQMMKDFAENLSKRVTSAA